MNNSPERFTLTTFGQLRDGDKFISDLISTKPEYIERIFATHHYIKKDDELAISADRASIMICVSATPVYVKGA